MDKLKVFTVDDVKKVLSIEKAIDAMENTFLQFSTGRAVNPLRTNIELHSGKGDILFMPAYIEGERRAGVKAITILKENFKQNLPAIHALVIVFNTETGKPEAIINGEAITAIRTGAASGLATKLLSRKNSKTLAIIGAGVQAATQLEAVCAVRPIEECIIFDRDNKKAELFIQKFQTQLLLKFKIGKSKTELYDCDIICTASNASGVLFEDENISEGTHINAIGAYRPDMIEIPNKTVARSKIIVDSKKAALEEAGDLIQAIRNGFIKETDIYSEIGGIVSGSRSGRTSDKEITFFKSVGLAIQDLAVASIIIDEGARLNIGTEIDL